MSPEHVAEMLGERTARYGVTATVTQTKADGWTFTRQVPYFELNANVHGILTDGFAEKVARAILDPFGTIGAGLVVSVGKL